MSNLAEKLRRFQEFKRMYQETTPASILEYIPPQLINNSDFGVTLANDAVPTGQQSFPAYGHATRNLSSAPLRRSWIWYTQSYVQELSLY